MSKCPHERFVLVPALRDLQAGGELVKLQLMVGGMVTSGGGGI